MKTIKHITEEKNTDLSSVKAGSFENLIRFRVVRSYLKEQEAGDL